MSNLKVWHNDTDWVVAETSEQATKLIKDAYGLTDTELADFSEWFSYKDEDPLTLCVETDTEPFFEMKTQSCRKWCNNNGLGILASTEY